jgi:acyl-CoA synthetase (NDP forming)
MIEQRVCVMAEATEESSQAVFRQFIKPRPVAIVGASDRMDYGRRLLRNLRDGGFTGAIYPVNPRRAEVQGLRAWPDVADIPEAADLAVIVVPGHAINSGVESCGKRGIRACAIITAGFGERGAAGEQEQNELLRVARQAGVRFSGPNSLGVANITDRIFAAAASNIAWLRDGLRPSGISVISHSGALSFNPVPSRAAERGIGLRGIVSVGNQADLGVIDFLEYFVEADEDTRAVALVLEGLPANQGRRLLQVARRARALNKPILAVKVGRSAGAAAVARSHTAALTGDDDVYLGAFRAAHITRVDDLDDLWETGTLLAAYPDFAPSGGSGFLSYSGGMNSLFSDQCGSHTVPLASPSTIGNCRSGAR